MADGRTIGDELTGTCEPLEQLVATTRKPGSFRELKLGFGRALDLAGGEEPLERPVDERVLSALMEQELGLGVPENQTRPLFVLFRHQVECPPEELDGGRDRAQGQGSLAGIGIGRCLRARPGLESSPPDARANSSAAP